MRKRKPNTDIHADSSSSKKRKKIEVYDNPWKAAKGERYFKWVNVEQQCEEPILPPCQSPDHRGLCFTSATSLKGKHASKRFTPSVSKLEFVNPLSSQQSWSEGLSKSTQDSRDHGKRKFSPHEILVSLESQNGTDDKSSSTPNMFVISEVSVSKSQNTPLKYLSTSTSCSSLTKYDPDREHTKDFTGIENFISESVKKENESKETIRSELREFMCPVSSSLKKTSSQINGGYLSSVSQATLATQEFTPVDQPIAKTSIKDINEILMADRLMKVEKRIKQKQKRAFTSTLLIPSSGRVLLPEPPVNSFLESDEDGISKSTSKKLLQKKPKPEYGSSKLLNHYKVLQKIGSGEFGTVLTVISRYDGCVYAIKKSNKMSIPLKLRVREMLCMSAIMSKGSSDNLVKYFGGWTEDNIVFIVMEYCERGNLQALRGSSSKFKFTPAVMRKILQQIASGLAHMHSMHLVHMDIKPDNILVSNDWKFKLCDFGHSTKLTVEGRPVDSIREGDKRYISNELLQGDYSDLYKSDIYSLGASIYGLVLDKALKGEWWISLRKGRLDPIKGYPDVLTKLLMSCIATRPACRPSAEILYKTLGENALVEEKQPQMNGTLHNLKSMLKSRKKEMEELKNEISKLEERNKVTQEKLNNLLQQCKKSASKGQFYSCKSFNLR